MRIVCWQTILMKHYILFFIRKLGKMSSAAVVIGALRVNKLTSCIGNWEGILVKSGPCTMIFLALGTLADIKILG